MSEAPDKDDESKFNETLKRMLDTPPKPHKPKDVGPKPDASRHSGVESSHERGEPVKDGGEAK